MLATCMAGVSMSAQTLVGTYDLNLQQVNIAGQNVGSAVTASVNVYENEDGSYSISEADGGNYFKGLTIPFTYNEASKMAEFKAEYYGQTAETEDLEFPYIWSSAAVLDLTESIPFEPQPTYSATFDVNSGFTFPEYAGIAWWLSDSDDSFNPADLYLGFEVLSASSTPNVGQYANPNIVGEWTITLNGHYIGEWSAGEFSEVFNATLDGDVVTFESTESQYNIVAEFTAQNILTFKKVAVVEALSSTYQVPYINNSGTDDVEDLEADVVESFNATYNPTAGTITFPAKAGLLYGLFNSSGVLSYWDDAFDLVSAKGAPVEEPVYGDQSIEGNWNFKLDGHYNGDDSIGEFNSEYDATLDGNTVTFTSLDSQFNIVAEFTSATNLSFKACAVMPSVTEFGDPVEKVLWQFPYVNVDGTDVITELDFTSFGATYNPSDNSITINGENVGIAYRYLDTETGLYGDWEDAFDVLSAAMTTAPEEQIYADPNIVGEWDFTLNDIYASEPKGEFTETLNATLDGNTVTFESTLSPYNIVAEFTSPTVLSFKKVQVGPSEIEDDGDIIPIQNPLWQSPYVNVDGLTDISKLTEQVFIAEYNPEEGTIKFMEDTGLRYGNFNAQGELVNTWLDAFDFVTATKAENNNFANEAIVGDWDITLDGAYLGDESKGKFTETMKATLNGNTVTFESPMSEYNIVAEFTAENTLTFNQVVVGDNTASYYSLYQSPYVNTTGTDDMTALTMESFTATFDPSAGTITFPANSGLRYGYFANETMELDEWMDAYDFVSAVKTSSSPEEGEVSGVMTATLANGETATWNVTAEFADDSVTIYNFAGLDAVKFSYDLSTGGIASEEETPSSVVEDAEGYSTTYYYASVETEELMLTGTIENDKVNNKTILNIATWGEATEVDGKLSFINEYKNTVVTLGSAVPGTTAIDSIGSEVLSGEKVIYDLQGRRVNNPSKGIYIIRQGDKVSKVMINN